MINNVLLSESLCRVLVPSGYLFPDPLLSAPFSHLRIKSSKFNYLENPFQIEFEAKFTKFSEVSAKW